MVDKFNLRQKVNISVAALALIFASLSTISLYQSKIDQIYHLSLFEVITEDDTYGGNLNPQKVYADIYYNKDQNSGMHSEEIPLMYRDSISNYCERAGINLVWVKDPSKLFEGEMSEIKDGALVTFSKHDHFIIWSSIEVSIYKAGLAAGGMKYRFYAWVTGWKLYSKMRTWIS